MPIRISRRCIAAALPLLLATAPAVAQMEAPGTVSSSASLAGIAQFKTDLDQGGDFHWAGAIAAASITRQFTAQMSAGMSVQYMYEDWSFSGNNVAFGGASPWSSLQRPIIGASVTYAPAPDIILGFSPSFGWSYANGASASDGQVYGAIVTATKVFSPNLVLGIGGGVYRDIGKTRAFPFLVVDWTIDDHWSVTNPFPAGPAGGAGLELVYRFDERWQLAGGAAYRNYRYRLAHDGPYADGIGETSSIPVFAKLTRNFGAASRIDFYAGVLLGGKLKVFSNGGDGVANDDFGAAPIVGLTLASRF